MKSGAAALQNGDFESLLMATTAYERARELRPESLETCLMLGRTYRRLTLHEETLALVNECQPERTPDPNLELMRGRALKQLGLGSEARAAFDAATMAGSAEAYFELGTLAQAEGDLDVAIEAFETMIRMRPRRARAYISLAQVHIDRLEFAPAAELLHRVLGMQACCAAQAHDLLGVTSYKGGDLAAAVEHGREAIRLDPDLEQAHYNLALALRDSGQREQSREAMQRFQEIAVAEKQRTLENNQEMQIVVINAQGLYYLRRDNPAKALELFETAATLEPNDAFLHFNIGLSRVAMDEHDSAITALEIARELQPGRAATYEVLANAYRAAGRPRDAQRIDELLQKLDPQY